MKKIIIGFVLGAVLAVSGSVFAESWNAVATPFVKLTDEEQIQLGHVYDQYTGRKLEVKLSPEEIRLRAIEARLDRLEANQK